MALIHTCSRITDIGRSVAFYGALACEEIGRLPIRDEAMSEGFPPPRVLDFRA